MEDNILMSLSSGSGGVAELLLDESLINQLQNSKRFAEEINQRIQDSRITEQQIDELVEKLGRALDATLEHVNAQNLLVA